MKYGASFLGHGKFLEGTDPSSVKVILLNCLKFKNLQSSNMPNITNWRSSLLRSTIGLNGIENALQVNLLKHLPAWCEALSQGTPEAAEVATLHPTKIQQNLRLKSNDQTILEDNMDI